jgi:hypothetical protein
MQKFSVYSARGAIFGRDLTPIGAKSAIGLFTNFGKFFALL